MILTALTLGVITWVCKRSPRIAAALRFNRFLVRITYRERLGFEEFLKLSQREQLSLDTKILIPVAFAYVFKSTRPPAQVGPEFDAWLKNSQKGDRAASAVSLVVDILQARGSETLTELFSVIECRTRPFLRRTTDFEIERYFYLFKFFNSDTLRQFAAERGRLVDDVRESDLIRLHSIVQVAIEKVVEASDLRLVG